MSTEKNNFMNSEKKEEKFNYRKKDNYEMDSPEKNPNLLNNDNFNENITGNINENQNKNKFEMLNVNEINKKKEEKNKNNEEIIIFPKNNENEIDGNKNRISNLKDYELPLEDKIQIENQVNENDNESEQIEDIKDILNNFGKEKYQKKYLIYKNKKKNSILKSTSVPNSKNNSILNKIKHDIALINFEQEINKICQNHKHDLYLKGEKLNINVFNNKKQINSNKSKNNILRIENIRKKLFPVRGMSINVDPLTKSINYHKKKDNNIIYINNLKQDNNNYYNSSNNFYNKKKKENIFDSFSNEMNNIKEIINITNYNYNQIYNNFYDTFGNKRIGIAHNEKKMMSPVITRRNIHYNRIESNFKTDESKNGTSNHNSNINLFFYNVFKNSVKNYPNLYLLSNKVNKMKYDDLNFNENNIKTVKCKDNEKIEKIKEDEEPKISILEKINLQKKIFQKEIDDNKKNYLNKFSNPT